MYTVYSTVYNVVERIIILSAETIVVCCTFLKNLLFSVAWRSQRLEIAFPPYSKYFFFLWFAECGPW